MIEEEEDQLMDPDGGEVIVDADYSDADLKNMRSMYVIDSKKMKIHKLTILSDISSERSVAKSFDRCK